MAATRSWGEPEVRSCGFYALQQRSVSVFFLVLLFISSITSVHLKAKGMWLEIRGARSMRFAGIALTCGQRVRRPTQRTRAVATQSTIRYAHSNNELTGHARMAREGGKRLDLMSGALDV